MGTVDCYSILLVFLVNCGFTLTNSVIFNFLVATARTILVPVLNTSVLSCIKHQGGVSCTAGHVLSCLFMCVCCYLFQSSLLHALLGELPPSQGQVTMHGRIMYVSQQPWMFSGTVRSNILFGKKYEEERYEKVIKACALEEVSLNLDILEFEIMIVLV